MLKRYRYFFTYLSLFSLVFFISNEKTYLLVFVLSVIIFFFVFRHNLFDTTYLTLLYALPFEKSIRHWILYAPFYYDPYQEGYYLTFGLTPKLILGLLLLLLVFTPGIKSVLTRINFHPAQKLMLLFFTLSAFLSVINPTQPTIVMIGLIQLGLSVMFYLFTYSFFSHSAHHSVFIQYILALIIFASVFGSLQLIRQRPTGRFIELTPSFSQGGYYTTDGAKQYRTSGFISHPVYYGSFLCILLPIIVGLFLHQIKSKQKIFLFILILTLTANILGTLSRSTWINIFITGLFFFIYLRYHQKFNQYFGLQIPILISGTLLIFAGFLFFSNSFLTRLNSVSTLMEGENSGAVRTGLNTISLNFLAQKPLTGVGLNNFGFETYQQGLSLDLEAPPHNTSLIILSELGLPAYIIFVFAVFLSLVPKVPLFKQSPILLGVWLGLITFIISSQFHPLFNLDPTFNLFMYVLAYYASQNRQNTALLSS